MATATAEDVLRRKERVVASIAMPGIPEGTGGRVSFVQGFDWVRYWVRFDNGVTRGSLNRSKLARESEWAEIQARRARGEADGGDAASAGAAGGADAAGDGSAAPAAAGEGYLHNGVLVPAHLLERSKKRREALGA